MSLFSIQLVRLVYAIQTPATFEAYLLVVPVHEMLNVIIRSVITAILILLTIWLWLGHNTHSGAGLNGIVQESLVAKESLRFAAHSRSYSEAESTSGYP